jgi:nucleotide-binding universal stress UspA family protein
MIFAEAAAASLPAAIGKAAIAWDFSRPASRAVADALPLIARASDVRVFAVTDDLAGSKAHGAVELQKYLARHGVQAAVDEVQCEGRSIGETFRSYVQTNRIELLVMGAYGHSRLREFILGGATRSMLAEPPCWVLMSH